MNKIFCVALNSQIPRSEGSFFCLDAENVLSLVGKSALPSFCKKIFIIFDFVIDTSPPPTLCPSLSIYLCICLLLFVGTSPSLSPFPSPCFYVSAFSNLISPYLFSSIPLSVPLQYISPTVNASLSLSLSLSLSSHIYVVKTS